MATNTATERQITIKMASTLYLTLETIARREKRSVTEAALRLLEEAARLHSGDSAPEDDTSAYEVARLAGAGGAFDWLADEPDLYDDLCGEPV